MLQPRSPLEKLVTGPLAPLHMSQNMSLPPCHFWQGTWLQAHPSRAIRWLMRCGKLRRILIHFCLTLVAVNLMEFDQRNSFCDECRIWSANLKIKRFLGLKIGPVLCDLVCANQSISMHGFTSRLWIFEPGSMLMLLHGWHRTADKLVCWKEKNDRVATAWLP